MLWSKDIHDRLTQDELAKSVPEAERLLELHQERKVCIEMMSILHVQTLNRQLRWGLSVDIYTFLATILDHTLPSLHL